MVYSRQAHLVFALELPAEVLDLREASVLLLPCHRMHRIPHLQHLRGELPVGLRRWSRKIRIRRCAQRRHRRNAEHQSQTAKAHHLEDSPLLPSRLQDEPPWVVALLTSLEPT